MKKQGKETNIRLVNPNKTKSTEAARLKKAVKLGQQTAIANFSAVLVGDTLGALVGKLDIGESDARLIVILVGSSNQIKMSYSPGISTAELRGTLDMAVDQVAINGREEEQ